MSVRVSTWAWEQELPGNEKLVLLALADTANDDGESWRGQVSIAGKVGTSERSARENLRKLEERGLIHRELRQRENGSRTSDLVVCLLPEVVAGRTPDQPEAERRSNRKPTSGPEPSEEPSGTSLFEDRAGEGDPLSGEMLHDAESLLRRKAAVDGQRVSEREMLTAATALGEFNRQSGSDYGLGAHLTPIVMRIRERPSYDGAAHRRLVQSAFRVRWWERKAERAGQRRGRGRVGPNVIYGNSRCFENVVQDAIDERNDKGQTGKRFVRRQKGERRAA